MSAWWSRTSHKRFFGLPGGHTRPSVASRRSDRGTRIGIVPRRFRAAGRALLLCGVCIALSSGGVVLFVTGAKAAPANAYYLALGDSVPVWNGTSSYPYLIASNYSSTNPGLQVVDMACSGETTGTMLANSLCAPAPQRSQ